MAASISISTRENNIDIACLFVGDGPDATSTHFEVCSKA